MKIHKLKAKHYKDLSSLLIDVGAVDTKTNSAFPSHVYSSKEDIKRMTREITKAFKKEYPYLRSEKIRVSVAMHMLNLSPNESLAQAVKPGFVLVDDNAIALELKESK